VHRGCDPASGDLSCANTPAVCRKSYINPVVFDAWRSGTLHRYAQSVRRAAARETTTLTFLRAQARSASVTARDHR
jgi:DNA topoisomerase IB